MDKKALWVIISVLFLTFLVVLIVLKNENKAPQKQQGKELSIHKEPQRVQENKPPVTTNAIEDEIPSQGESLKGPQLN